MFVRLFTKGGELIEFKNVRKFEILDYVNYGILKIIYDNESKGDYIPLDNVARWTVERKG